MCEMHRGAGRDQGLITTRFKRRGLQAKLTVDNGAVASARAEVADLAGRARELGRGQHAYEHFEAAEGWRRDEITRLRDRLDQRSGPSCSRPTLG